MITVLNPGQQLKFLPIDQPIIDELTLREKDKNRLVNRVPFLRTTCLQKVLLSDDEDKGKQNNLKDSVFKSVLGDRKQVDGFIFEFNSNFDESYSSKKQVIGTELSSLEKIQITNPRRVPPPTLTSFTATIGEEVGFYTTAKLTFTAHSKEQLEFLTPFLLHPGNTIVFEWGYSDKSTTMNKDNDLFTKSDLADFLGDIAYDKEKRVTSSQFFKKRQEKVLESNGNYEFLVGVISNFDFSLNENYGFDISIDLWSISKTLLSSKSPSVFTQDNNIDTDAKKLLINNQLQDFKHWTSYLEDKIEGAYLGPALSQNKSIPISLKPYTVPRDATRTSNNSFSTQPLINTDEEIENTVREFDEFDDVIQINTNYGYEKYMTLRKILKWMGAYNVELKYNRGEVLLNPFIISNNYKVLFFRNKQPNLKAAKINTKSGKLSFNVKDIEDKFVSYKSYVIPETVEYSTEEERILERTQQAATNPYPSAATYQVIDNEVGRNLVNTIKKIKSYTPRKLDIGESNEGDIFNTYYNISTFEALYERYDGNSNDILREITRHINEASGNIWDLRLISSTDTESESSTTENMNLTSLNSLKIPKDSSYTFKINQKESVVKSLTFDLGLEGLIADQIYFESTDQSDKSPDASQLNLLLFEKHENGIKLLDFRNQAIANLRDEFLKDEGDNSSNSSQSDNIGDEEFLSEYYENDPSEFGLVFGVTNIEEFEEKLYKVTSENDTDSISKILKDNDANSFPSFDYNKQAYFEMMSTKGYLPSKNSDEDNSDDNEDIDQKISPLLESRLQFDLPGLGGFQPLQYFSTDGLPDVYDKRGDFCIMSLSQVVSPVDWTTSISAAFRPKSINESKNG